jgi:hypothetical protein
MRLEVRVDGGTFGPESKLLQGKEVVCFEEVFQAIGENFLKNFPCNVQEGYWYGMESNSLSLYSTWGS